LRDPKTNKTISNIILCSSCPGSEVAVDGMQFSRNDPSNGKISSLVGLVGAYVDIIVYRWVAIK